MRGLSFTFSVSVHASYYATCNGGSARGEDDAPPAPCWRILVFRLAWIIREDGDFEGDTGASAWYKRFVHKRLTTTETPA